MKEALVIFAKNPQQGKVKTRLAKTIGNAQALLVYQRLLSVTLSVTKDLPADKFVFYSDFIDTKDNWPNNVFRKELQSGNNLGDRMKNAFKSLFTAGYDKIVLIGTDCPEITSTHLINAFAFLNEVEAVLGPTTDGGYYLVGLRQFHPELFKNIDWSTDKVFQQTLAVCDSLNLKVAFLQQLNDIDDVEDLKTQKDLIFQENHSK